MLVDLKLLNVLSARQTCVLAFWASRAGATGFAADLALRPDQQSGSYCRHFDKVVGCSPHDHEFYNVKLGRRLRHESSRRFDDVPTLPPHELLAAEVAASSSVLDAFAQARRDGVLPSVYTQHQLVVEAPDDEPCVPIAMYLDGVSFSRLDSALGVFVNCLLRARDISTQWSGRLSVAPVVAGEGARCSPSCR